MHSLSGNDLRVTCKTDIENNRQSNVLARASGRRSRYYPADRTSRSGCNCFWEARATDAD